MGVPDPCCGMNLQRATKILAIIEIVFSVIGLILGAIALVGVIALKDQGEFDKPDSEYYGSYGVVLAAVAIIIIVCVFDLIISIILLLGANQRDLTKCRIWFVVAVGLMVLSVAGLIGNIVGGNVSGTSVAGNVVSLVVRGYVCWVVLAFMAELKGVNVPTN